MSNRIVTENDIGSGLEIVANKLKTIPITKADIGLSNVDNTSDVNKPISSATQTALDGKADLVAGFVPASQLPSYVDDIVEGASLSALPTTGESSKIYVTLDTNKIYRWSGSGYVEIIPTYGTTDSIVEGVTNLYFTQARVSANSDVVALLAKMHDALTLGANQNGLSLAGQVLQLALASSSTTGALSATDWNTFNNKLSSITSAMVVSALGFTPYDASNPSGFITGSSLTWSNISGKPSFFSGDYNDLSNKPTIPAGQVNSDWNASSGLAQIFNKPTIPTNTNQLTNGAGYITGVTNAMVLAAIGYTPYNSSNPAGYITGYSETDTLQSVTNRGNTTSQSITAPAFYQTSDKRLKDILEQDGDVIRFKWNDLRDDKIHIGYIAQDVQKVLPNQVNEAENGELSVNYIEVLVDKVRKLEKELEFLKNKF